MSYEFTLNSLPIADSIKRYIKSNSRKENKKLEKAISSKIREIAILEVNKLPSDQIKGKKIKLKKIIPLKRAEVTEAEAKKFKNTILSPEVQKLLDLKWKSGKDIMLTNGKTLFAAELLSIQIMTTHNYLLVNGTLDNDDTSLDMWKEESFEDEKPSLLPEDKEKYLKKAQKYVDDIAKFSASGIRKLPPFKGLIYRGDAVPSEILDEWKKGKIIITPKFFSCSCNVAVAEEFSKINAIEYMAFKGKEYQPVLFVFNSKNSKDISNYSVDSDEEERIYTPGQAFRSIEVDEKTVPGLAIIYMEEIN